MTKLRPPSAPSVYFCAREVMDPEARERGLFARLPGLIAHAMQAPGWKRQLEGLDPRAVTDRNALGRLPILRKASLMQLQADHPPLGGLACAPASSFKRLFLSPGPVAEPEGDSPDWWGAARGLYAAGIRPGDVAINCFSYHLTPGARFVESGMHTIGATVIPGGIGNTDQQIEAIARYRATGYLGTADFLKILLDRAAELGKSTRTLSKAFVSGAALPSSLRSCFTAQGVSALQGYALADLGLIAYETVPEDGLVINEDRIVEIVHPVTCEPVEDGEVGEIVVTSFNNDYPMIRLATGDLSAIKPGQSTCGRTNRRLVGWLGRADQSAKVKGQFVHPTQVAEIARRFCEITAIRLIVFRMNEQDALRLEAECATITAPLELAISRALKDITKLSGDVVLVPPGTLTPDGRSIIDTR